MATEDVKSAHVVLLKLKHKDGGFASKEQLENWLNACLNCNKMHVEAEVSVETTLPQAEAEEGSK